jgi:hypothetical protein
MLSKVLEFTLTPRRAWESVAGLSEAQYRAFMLYPVILALLPTFAWYYGTTQVGWRIADGHIIRLAEHSGLAIAVCFYLAQIAAIWIIGYLVHWMSNTYGAITTPAKGMALVGFTATPILLAGVVGFVPNFAVDLMVGILAVSYSVYLLYVGIPIAMQLPAERGFLYASAVVGVSLVIVVSVMGASLILWSFGLEPVFTD